MSEQPKYTNRLAKEKSLYLLQHAHNPVDWYPWSHEAFRNAQELDRPIFLSIGYATCHWCHKMEQESFQNEEIARLLNETFINIKIDREELPQVDSLYMEFAQSMMSGAAGWPLNLILTPELRPFFAATYLPPYTLHGMVGLADVVRRIKEVWAGEEKERVLEQAHKIVQIFQETTHTAGEHLPTKESVQKGIHLLFQMADPIFGGMKGAPKFPIGYQMNLLTRYSLLQAESRALFLVETTLDKMYRGGIYDHLGGGFSRYSVDEEWMIPHFEKMLYDNALLAFAYLEAWQATKKSFYRDVVEEIFGYLLRDMKNPQGGFYSAEDSDSEGKEGYFYTWSHEEIVKILTPDEALLATEYFDITPQGNFEGRNILHTPASLDEFAQQRNIHPLQLRPMVREVREKLWHAREGRVHPLKDDKILTSWNGLMIHALAEGGAAFREREYIDAAVQTARFLRSTMWDGTLLYHRWREGETQFPAGIDDYAFLIRGLLSLFEIGEGVAWLQWAMELTLIMQDRFKKEEGAFYQTDGSDPYLLLRRCPYSDGAEPSGNAIQAENLLRLYQMTMNPAYRKSAEDVLRAVKKYIDVYPPGYAYHLMNILRDVDRRAPTILIALNEEEKWKTQLHHACFETLIPHRAVIWKRENDEELMQMLPWVQDYIPVEGKTTLYVCREAACGTPINELIEMVKAIRKL